MAIQAINGSDVNINNIGFCGKNKNQKVNANNIPENPSKSTSNYAAIPLAVLMSLSPSLLNSKISTQLLQEQKPEVELYDSNYVQPTKQGVIIGKDFVDPVDPGTVRYKKNIKLNGKDCIMYFVGPNEKYNENNKTQVTGITFVLKTFRPRYDKYGQMLNSGFMLHSFRTHNVPGQKKTYSMLADQWSCTKDGKVRCIRYSLALPDDAAREIMKLRDDKFNDFKIRRGKWSFIDETLNTPFSWDATILREK